MNDNPLLEVEDFDELLAKALADPAAIDRPPVAFPSSDDECRDLLKWVEEDQYDFTEVLTNLLCSISIEATALTSIAVLTITPPPQFNVWPFLEFRRIHYIRHCTGQEHRAALFAVKRMWEIAKESQITFGEFLTLWPILPQALDDPGNPFKIPKRMRERAKRELGPVIAATKDKPHAWNAAGHVLQRAIGLDDMRDVLKCLREIFKAIDGVIARLRDRLGLQAATTPSSNDAETDPIATPKPDGLLPPKSFYWKGSLNTVPGIRWRMLNQLWIRRSMSDADLGMALWGEEWDESKLTTTVNRLNNDLSRTPWRVNRSGGKATLSRSSAAGHTS